MEENSLLISVIIPMFNASKTIVRALDSIKNQTLECGFEVLVVNDGSKDNSKEIVEKYISENKEFKVILIDKPNGGVSTARNAGLSASRGDLIAFLDSDDEWFSDKLDKQKKILDMNPEIDLLGCAFDGLHFDNLSEGHLMEIEVDHLIFKNYFQPSTVIMKRTIFEKIGYFDEKQKYAEEGNYFIRIADKFNCFFCNMKVINYGDGKSGFGASGLSANLKEMHRGFIKNLKFAYSNDLINLGQYVLARIVEQLKYMRRIVIVGLKK
ncbi:glycosyltransferase family A protein [Acinetobacter sp.]|jgi:glycosyltransferase involved in cell wall biosynthesis|uniref:glycosyltransferase family 2 protein n=1 Tax=Acinetobacter sp. TaxID=472 RepID=UPI00281CE117|nr:glycosyltransferase family A protein [Acinetobacter sp.]MDR0234807.1 glycosyltransferase family 2 protein [Acinetobacter sp.]MDR2279137.1 glycosyltransferase family 2 protein [Vagococcus sp.]